MSHNPTLFHPDAGGSTVIVVPQLGEGLTEARIVSLLKRPGDQVGADEAIFALETDKANVEIEAPHAGVIGDWLVREGQTVPIHAPVVHIIAPQAVPSQAVPSQAVPPPATDPSRTQHALAPSGQPGAARIPPRTRALCRSLGLDEQALRAIPARTGTLLEADVLAHLKSDSDPPLQEQQRYQGKQSYHDRPLSDRQRTFIRRAAPASPLAPLAASVKRPLPWACVERAFKAARKQHPELRITHFQLMAYHVVQTAASHPKFRSVLIGQECVREFAHVNLGIAVALPGDELATALLPQADTLDFSSFAGAIKTRTREARRGQDQADATMQIVLTCLGNSGITDASPTLVAPAVAVLFIGDKYEGSGGTLVNLVLTFDHRLINGLGAARFLQALVRHLERAGAE